jgi:hypothetical protein
MGVLRDRFICKEETNYNIRMYTYRKIKHEERHKKISSDYARIVKHIWD